MSGRRPVERPSPNFDERPVDVSVDMLVLHYTGMTSAEAALDRICDPAAKVSAHYLIDEDGAVYALVPESKRAWHAGVACWRGHRNINGRSIGIELANPGHEHGYRDFTAPQMAALADLARAVLARHPIPPSRSLHICRCSGPCGCTVAATTAATPANSRAACSTSATP